MPTFEEVKAASSLPEDSVWLCVAGKLAGQMAELQRQRAAPRPPQNLGERSQASVLDERIAELTEQMRAATFEFKLRAIAGRVWDAYWATRPVRRKDEDDDSWQPRIFDWTAKMVARTCVDPVMTADQVAELVDDLSGSGWADLQNSCLVLNMGRVEVPNFVTVSSPTQTSDETLRPPTEPASATANGSATNRPKRRSTSTTTTGDSFAA